MARTLASVPSFSSQKYTGTTDTVKQMNSIARGPRGELSLKLRLTVEDIIRDVEARDKLSQLAAIYHWFDKHFTYVNDPVQVELVKDPERLLEEIESHGSALGDCDDASTFLFAAPRTIGIETSFVRVGFKPAPLGGRYTHVFVGARDQYGRTVILDPVAGKNTQQMLGRVTQMKFGY